MSNPRPLSEEGTGDAGRANHCSSIPGICDKAAMTLSASADFECTTVLHKSLAFSIPGICDNADMTLSASADFECATVLHMSLAFAI